MGNILNVIVDFELYTENHSKIDERDAVFKTGSQFGYYNIADPVKRDLIDIENNPNEYFYYSPNACNTFFLAVVTKLRPTYIPFSEKIVHYLKNYKNFRIYFCEAHECFGEDFFVLIKNTSQHFGLDPNQFVIIDDDHNFDYYVKKHDFKPIHHISNHHMSLINRDMENYEINFVKDKEFFFLCHNKTMKAHRILVLSYLEKYNLLNDTNWSNLQSILYKKMYQSNVGGMKDNFFDFLIEQDEYLKMKKYIDIVTKEDMKKSKYEGEMTWHYINDRGSPAKGQWGNYYEPKTYETSYVNITTESTFERRGVIHVTEKSFIPFHSFQIPIIFATCGHVNAMKKRYGFDFFDDIINHDEYDSEIDDKLRFKKVFKQITNLHNRKTDIIEFYKNNYERFYQNKLKMHEFTNNEYDQKFLKCLIL